jgi:hypothetical protein
LLSADGVRDSWFASIGSAPVFARAPALRQFGFPIRAVLMLGAAVLSAKRLHERVPMAADRLDFASSRRTAQFIKTLK